MSNPYKPAADRIILLEEEPMRDRKFQLVLVDPRYVKFDVAHMDLESILEPDVQDAVRMNDRVTLRTQIINNPLQPVNIGTKILQFFLVDSAPTVLHERGKAAILIENIDGEDTPLFFLNADEVWELAHGGGFATTVFDEALEATLG